MGRRYPLTDLQAQCPGQRAQPVEVSGGMKGIGPDVEGARRAGAHGQGERSGA